MTRLLQALALALLALGVPLPAQAAVTMTFWSHELGNYFPHAFFTLRGVPEAGGAPIDANIGFTAKSISPAMLFGSVPGRLDIAKPGYMDGSDAQFSVEITDAQLAQILALAAEWDEKGTQSRYHMNRHNCVTFVREAARIAGLAGLDQPKLMKKPRSFLKAVEAANVGRVTPINQHGKDYRASLPPLDTSSGAPITEPVKVTPSASPLDKPLPGKAKAAVNDNEAPPAQAEAH